jgi:hypothetical protein
MEVFCTAKGLAKDITIPLQLMRVVSQFQWEASQLNYPQLDG